LHDRGLGGMPVQCKMRQRIRSVRVMLPAPSLPPLLRVGNCLAIRLKAERGPTRVARRCSRSRWESESACRAESRWRHSVCRVRVDLNRACGAASIGFRVVQWSTSSGRKFQGHRAAQARLGGQTKNFITDLRTINIRR
jgi:hypothetical protein